MATRELNFEMVANNTVQLQVDVLDQNGDAVDGTGILAIKWQWFIAGNTITKSLALGNISISTYNPLVFDIHLDAADTLGSPEGYYPHEAIATDVHGNPVTITDNNPQLTWGVGFLRRQLTVQ